MSDFNISVYYSVLHEYVSLENVRNCGKCPKILLGVDFGHLFDILQGDSVGIKVLFSFVFVIGPGVSMNGIEANYTL